MASSTNKERSNSDILREWAPLTELIDKIPIKHGLFAQNIKITCVDVLPGYLILGTNVGLVYWYDRKQNDLQELRCEATNASVTTIKVISSVDFMIACGTKDGNINLFQIPKLPSESLPENLKPKQKHRIQRYIVSELHKSPITALEWSKNGMKLFSGDKNGCVVFTEIDFYMHICKSLEIINETYEVVQLSYYQQHLLVSTTFRSIICQNLGKWKVCQVGKKDRKVMEKFGGIVYQSGFGSKDIVLYCSRPGLRIWVSDVDGNVQKTLLFKELLHKECPEVPLINPISKNLLSVKPKREASFGVLLPFNGNLLVTYNNDVVYILDPEKMCVMYKISHLRSVLWVATCKDEIFILEEDRSLVRISYFPNYFAESSNSSGITNSFWPITKSIKSISSKLRPTNIISAIPPLLEQTLLIENASVIESNDIIEDSNAEEAKENKNVRIQKQFDEVGSQSFSEKIIFKHSKIHRKQNNMSASVNSLSSTSSEEKEFIGIKPNIISLSSIGVLPDLRSPESIQNDIEYKEKILADLLNLHKVKIASAYTDSTHENSKPFKNDIIHSSPNGNESQLNKKTSVLKQKELNPTLAIDILPKKQPTISVNNATKLVENESTSQKVLSKQKHYSSSLQNGKDVVKENHTPINLINGDNLKDVEPDLAITVPGCLNLPNNWKISQINLCPADTTLSDSSLADWEII